ncbi:hypothetical protein NA78x_005688 [Anatilimnocola sp. NA78]
MEDAEAFLDHVDSVQQQLKKANQASPGADASLPNSGKADGPPCFGTYS